MCRWKTDKFCQYFWVIDSFRHQARNKADQSCLAWCSALGESAKKITIFWLLKAGTLSALY